MYKHYILLPENIYVTSSTSINNLFSLYLNYPHFNYYKEGKLLCTPIDVAYVLGVEYV